MKGKPARPSRISAGRARAALRSPATWPIGQVVSPALETSLYVFGLIALGYLSGLTGYLKTETGDG